MSIVEYGPLAVLIIAALAGLAGLIEETPDDALRKFRKDCRAQGLDFAETETAIAVRLAFVRLRRMASDLCMSKDGEITRSEINEIAGDLAIGMAAAHGLDASKSFIAWIDSCPDEEILYDDARKARHRKNVEYLHKQGLYPPKDTGMDQDFKDAFTIMKR